MAKRRTQTDQRADLRGGGFVGLPHCVFDSEAYLALDVYARAVLNEIIRRFNGYNNGSIAVSQAELMRRLETKNPRRVIEAIRSLVEKGLIDVPFNGHWKQGKAREYRLTFVSTGKPPQSFYPATNDYRTWKPTEQPEKSGSAARAPKTPPLVLPEHQTDMRPVLPEHQTFEAPLEEVPNEAPTFGAPSALLIVSHTQGAKTPVRDPHFEAQNRGGPIAAPVDDGESNPLAAFDPLDDPACDDKVRPMAKAYRRKHGATGIATLSAIAGVGTQQLARWIDNKDTLSAIAVARVYRLINQQEAA